MASKLGKKEREARTVAAKVPKNDRAAVVKRASSTVSARASIDFQRSVRNK